MMAAVGWPGAAPAVCTPSPLPPDTPLALVLSGGGSKGAYEAGVAAAFLRRGLPIRLAAGSSAGALNAWALDSAGSLFDPQPLRELIASSVDLGRIRASPVRLLVVTTDLARRERRVFDNQTVTVEALMAAAAVPGAFPPVEVDGALLVDGGLVSRAPVLEALASGTPVGRVVVVMSYAPDERGQRPTSMRRTIEEAFEMSMIHQIGRDTELARLKYPGVEVQLLTPSTPLLVRPLDFDAEAMSRMLDRGETDALACLRAWEGR